MFKKIFLLLIAINFIFNPAAVLAQQSTVTSFTTQVGDPTDPKPPDINSNNQSGSAPSGNFVFYCQGNTSWKDTCGLGVAGCGPSSLAMVISTLSKTTMTPPEVDKVFSSSSWRACGNAPSNLFSALNSSWLTGLGLKVGPNLVSGRLNLDQAKQFLDKGALIIGSSQEFPCANCITQGTKVNHIFVIDSVDPSSNSLRVRDPNNCSYSDGNDENPDKMNKKVTDFPWYYAYPIEKVQ